MKAQNWLLEVVVLSVVAVLVCLSKPTDKRNFQLPESLNPEHYEISLSPMLDKNIFQGVVVISGVAVVDTRRIVLHCRNLLFNATSLTDLTDDEEVTVEDITEDPEQQQCLLFLNQTLKKDHEYKLTMEFMGIIGKEGVGLYRDFYYEEGVKHDILMTHFQPNYARAMFPCFDEPHYKAQFLLRVARQDFPTVISNMPASPTTIQNPEESLVWVEFEETPPMSSYLLVLVMCDYISLSDSTTNSSVWAPRSRLHEAQLALNISVSVLEQCESYFGVQHVLPKLDHVPVPTLNTAAMENWGAITYKRDFLLWEEGVSTWTQRETVAYVICHEIVHQWLGNLVTTTWWNTTWLNEGVTSFYHYYFIDKIEPSWNVMDTMFVTQIQLIFNEEAKRDPKPLTNNEPFTTQEAIASEAFSASTYVKGAAIMRMVYSLLEPDVFREAIVQYIMDNEYESVDEVDLWQSLAAVSDLSVDLESVMHTWTHEPGYPLVTVIRGSDGCISLKQEKYLSKIQETRWTIPVTYTTSSELNFNSSRVVWFPGDQEELTLPGVCLSNDEWILLNIRQNGFYRVNYDLRTWQLLTDTLVRGDLSSIHPVNRGQLLHDSFDLALHGFWPFPNTLHLTRFLRRETDFLSWFIGVRWLSVLKAHLYKSDCFPLYQRYVLGLVNDSFNSMSLIGDAGGLLKELHRKQIVEFACGMGHPGCVKEATNIIYLLMSGVHIKVPLDLKPVLLCSAVRYGQDEVWHFTLKEYLAAAENERWKYLSALACTSKLKTVERLLKDVANPSSFVKTTEERLTLLVELGKQEDALEPILNLIIDQFNTLSTNFNFEMILNIVRTFLTRLPTPQEKEKIMTITFMVRKTQNPKQIELMQAIHSDIDKLDFNMFYKDIIMQWLEKELNDTKEQPNLTPISLPTDVAPSPISDDEETEINLGNEIDKDEDLEEHVEPEDNELDDLEEDDVEETPESNESNVSDQNVPKDFGAKLVASTRLLFVLIILVCVIR